MKRLSIIVAILVLFVTTRAWAWGSPAHSIIGYIAEMHLTPQAKEKCHHYIHHTLAYEASWLDNWRYCKGFKNANWHIGYSYPNREYRANAGGKLLNPEGVRKSAAYRINDQHTVIVADGYFTITNDNGDILDKIAVSSFAKSPRAGFKKIKKVIE
jgi:hypothetical protein